MLTVTSAADSFDLTRVETVRTELGLPDTRQDALLRRLISHASDVISKQCNKVFAQETVTETFRLARCERELVLARYPVTVIGEVAEDGTMLTASDYELEPDVGLLLRLSDDSPSRWAAGKISVSYTAGFPLLDGLPFGVQRACVALVKHYFLSADRDPMLRSEQLDGLGQSAWHGGALPPEVEGLLSPHRKPAIG